MSLLLAEGHWQARQYPVGHIWSEVEIVRDRLNGATVTNATMTNAAVAATNSKKGFEYFKNLIRKMTDG